MQKHTESEKTEKNQMKLKIQAATKLIIIFDHSNVQNLKSIIVLFTCGMDTIMLILTLSYYFILSAYISCKCAVHY